MVVAGTARCLQYDMKLRPLLIVGVAALSAGLIAQPSPPVLPEVPYPDGFRRWMHICSVVTPPKKTEGGGQTEMVRAAPPHGLIHHLYANELALEGYRTGHFPEGAVLIADWFLLEESRSGLVQGPRSSTDVMIRDPRYAATGGWGFEKFDQDSHTTRKVGPKAATTCFECHGRAKDHEFVFSVLKP
jgi:hypothetical protein